MFTTKNAWYGTKKFKQAGFSGHLKCTQNKKYSQKQKMFPINYEQINCFHTTIKSKYTGWVKKVSSCTVTDISKAKQ